MSSILISNPVWGGKNCEIFCNYSLKSLLYEGNIPLLNKYHDITLHILTRREDLIFFEKNIFFKSIPNNVKVDFFFFKKIFTLSKYSKVSKLQNISIKKSTNYDFIVFNYADFIWSDFSLSNSINKLIKKKLHFLSFFCLPVEHKHLKSFVEKNKKINQLELSNFSAKNLHREAKLRIWNEKKFTMTPTFIIFKIQSEGLIISAYHQTVLAASVESNHILKEGIKGISLDEYFSSVIKNSKFETVCDSQDIMVSAICDWEHDSSITDKKLINPSIKKCFKRLNNSNRHLSSKLISISINKNKKLTLWTKKEQYAIDVINNLNSNFPFHKIEHFFLTNKYIAPIYQFILYFLIGKSIIWSGWLKLWLKLALYLYGQMINYSFEYFFYLLEKKLLKKNVEFNKPILLKKIISKLNLN